MNVKSMTGFGRATLSLNEFDITVDIKSVNSKYLDPTFKMPRILSSYELEFRKILQDKIARGKVELKIDILLKTTNKIPKLNTDLLIHYKNILEEIKTKSKVNDEITLNHYLRMPDLIDFITDEKLEKTIEEKVVSLIYEAINSLNDMRIKEGTELIKDISSRLDTLQAILINIDKNKTDIFTHHLNKFKTRLAQFDIIDTNNERIVQEAIIFSEKADITEEVTRAKSHIDQYKSIINNDNEVGKKLDFLSIELTREFNTIASKSSNCEIINSVVSAKAEVDRIREQVQNLL